jgi:predicted secreted protein
LNITIKKRDWIAGFAGILIVLLILLFFHGAEERSVSNLYIIPAGTFSPFPGTEERSVSNLYIIPAGTFSLFPSPAECRENIDSRNRTVINETHNNSTICTSSDGPFSLQLNENSRTGFQWKITAGSGLQVVDEGVSWYDENGAPTRMPGIRGIHQWTIFPKTPGIQRIRAVLQRPEGSTGHEQVFALNVMVK